MDLGVISWVVNLWDQLVVAMLSGGIIHTRTDGQLRLLVGVAECTEGK